MITGLPEDGKLVGLFDTVGCAEHVLQRYPSVQYWQAEQPAPFRHVPYGGVGCRVGDEGHKVGTTVGFVGRTVGLDGIIVGMVGRIVGDCVGFDGAIVGAIVGSKEHTPAKHLPPSTLLHGLPSGLVDCAPHTPFEQTPPRWQSSVAGGHVTRAHASQLWMQQ